MSGLTVQLSCTTDDAAVVVSPPSASLVGGNGASFAFQSSVGGDNARRSTFEVTAFCVGSAHDGTGSGSVGGSGSGSDSDNSTLPVWTTVMSLRNTVWPCFSDVVRGTGHDNSNNNNGSDDSSSVTTTGTFSFSTYGAENVTLLPDSGHRVTNGPVFARSGVSVTVGGVSAVVWGVDDVTGGLVVTLPSWAAVCGSDGRRCMGVNGYKNIVVKNPDRVVVEEESGPDGSRVYTAVPCECRQEGRDVVGEICVVG